MKQAIIGLRKRETYEELINDLNHDPSINYPDRKASELENSPYLSQLRAGFEEMMLQNDNLMKERQKEVLLHEEAGKASIGRHEIAIHSDRWRHHVPPEPAEVFHTPDRPPPAPPPELIRQRPESSPLRHVYPALARADPAFAQALQKDIEIQISETRSRSAKKPITRDEPMIQEVDPENNNIGTPLNTPIPKRGRGRPKKVPAHDVDPQVEETHQVAMVEEELARKRQKEKSDNTMNFFALMLDEAAANPNMDDFMAGRGDKRREEEANPAPPKPKAKTQPKKEATEPPPQSRASASTNPPQPKAKPKASPKKEAKPKAEAQPKAEAPPEAEAQSKSKSIPVKKDMFKNSEQKGTAKVHHHTFEEWKRNSNKGSLIDQYNLRTKQGIGPYLATKTDIKTITVKQLIEKILAFDKKYKK